MVNDWVMEPMLVKTVSYLSVSLLVVNLAAVDVMKESFLQAESKKQNTKGKKQYTGFINFIFQK
jgi:hypothetical protein